MFTLGLPSEPAEQVYSCCVRVFFAAVAQWLERRSYKAVVVGSIPTSRIPLKLRLTKCR